MSLPCPAALAAAALLAAGCLPSTWVARRAPPPVEVARAAAHAPAPQMDAGPGGPAPAAPAAPPRSLADLVDLALSRDPATRAAWHDARSAAAQAGARRSLYLPSLDASATLARQRPASAPGRSPDTLFTTTTLTPSATLTWLLLDLGARGALVDEADRLLAAARLGEHAAVADLVLRVQETYFGFLAARALVEAESAAVKQAEASLEAAEARQRAGLATIADVLQARTALSQTRLALQETEGQALALRGALATLAGLPPTTELEVGALPAEVDAAAVRPPVDALLAAAAARNPDVGSARALADAADARARAASRAFAPTLSFQGSVSRSWLVATADPDPAAHTGWGSTGWSAGLVLRLPLLEGLGLRSAYDALATRASADAALARADAAAQRVALDVWTSFQGLETAGRRIGTTQDLVASARASADVAQGRYKEGVGSIVDRLNAQAALELALAEDVRARTDFLVALARLARASGRLELPEDGTNPASPEGPRAP
jgi:outer membrane protein TolC